MSVREETQTVFPGGVEGLMADMISEGEDFLVEGRGGWGNSESEG